jgi:hypothetical protein
MYHYCPQGSTSCIRVVIILTALYKFNILEALVVAAPMHNKLLQPDGRIYDFLPHRTMKMSGFKSVAIMFQNLLGIDIQK